MDNKNLNISDSEWNIMKVLWDRQGATLKEIAAALSDTKWSYTTIRTLVTRLMEKEAIGADKSNPNNFIYFPLIAESECIKKETKKFMSKVFDGSISMLVFTLAKDSNLSKKEQEELMAIIEKMEEV